MQSPNSSHFKKGIIVARYSKDRLKEVGSMTREALYYKKKDLDRVRCELCPHHCLLSDKQRGRCSVREVRDGSLYTLNYGAVSSAAIDPIEKKPLYHFKPGKYILSLGSFGCNFSCSFCQNYSISKELPDTQHLPPEELIGLAKDKKQSGSVGIAFTYNEPSIWYEYVYDVARLAENKELDIILVTNGFINKDPLEALLPYINALNIDLKAFTPGFYEKVCGGKLEGVMNTIKTSASKSHVEITTLLVNGYNDSVMEVEELAKWLSSVNPAIPLHLTRYYPNYKLSVPPTPERRLQEGLEAAKKHLQYVYVGNIGGFDNNTYCPECKELLVDRSFYEVKVYLKEPKCPECGYPIYIIL